LSRFPHLEARYSEAPFDFLRTERWAIGICSLVFSAVMLAAIFSVDPAYYYPRLITDQLLYYLKGLSFVHEGTTAARVAVNTEPFNYAAGPGLLRAPWIALFPAFDDQLRAIQVTNVVTALALASMFAYIASWVLPRKAHSALVVFSFASLVLNPVWVGNVLSPLADLPYAAASLGALIVLTRLIAGTAAERSSQWRNVLFTVLFVIAFACRFTAPVIAVYGWLLHRSLRPASSAGTSRRRVTALMIAAFGFLLAATALRPRVVAYYVVLPLIFILRAGIPEIIGTLVLVAVPSQVLPGLELLYERPPLLNMYRPVFATTPFDIALTVLGLTITAVTALGMWVSRRNLQPAIAFVLVPLPLLAAIIPSTARYLHSYQPFYWIFMYAGAVAITARLAPRFVWTRRTTIMVATVACAVGASAVYVRSGRFLQGEKVTLSNLSLGETRRGAADVAATYRSLRTFLERLPRNETLLVGTQGAIGQWKAIAGMKYYYVDSSLVDTAREKAVYLVLACPTPGTCSDLERVDGEEQKQIREFGRFEFSRVFDIANRYSAARVYLIKSSG
jgi:hypothetical protein